MKQRKRVSAEDVRNNARNSGGGGGIAKLLTLPRGVGLWEPDKEGKFAIDFLPYEVSGDDHPDKIDKGTVWWKYPFQVHRGVGVNKEEILCPRAFGKPCPVCEEKDRLAQNWDENEKEIRALKAQKWTAFKIRRLGEPTEIDVFAISDGKFFSFDKGAGGLKYEIESGDEKNLNFYELIDGMGRTVTTRFAKANFEGTDYFKASRFDFAPRPDVSAKEENRVIEALCLDDLFGNLLPYDKIKALFANGAADDDSDAGDDEDPKPRQSGRKRGAGKPDPEPEPDSEEPEDAGEGDDEPEEKAPKGKPGKFKVGDRVAFDGKAGRFEGKILEIDGDTATVENDEGDEEDAEIEDLEAADKPAPKSDKKSGRKPAPEPEEKTAFKPDDWVKDDDGIVGKVIKVKGTEVHYQDAAGTKYVEDAEDLEAASAPAPAGGDDVSDGEETEIKVGDSVTWDDGMEEGTVLKVINGKAKVKGKDGVTQVLKLSDLAKA